MGIGRRGPRTLPRRLHRDPPRHLVESEDGPARVGQLNRARPGDQPVAITPPAELHQGQPAGEDALGRHAKLGGQPEDVPLGRPGKLASHVDDMPAGQAVVQYPPANPVPRLWL